MDSPDPIFARAQEYGARCGWSVRNVTPHGNRLPPGFSPTVGLSPLRPAVHYLRRTPLTAPLLEDLARGRGSLDWAAVLLRLDAEGCKFLGLSSRDAFAEDLFRRFVDGR